MLFWVKWFVALYLGIDPPKSSVALKMPDGKVTEFIKNSEVIACVITNVLTHAAAQRLTSNYSRFTLTLCIIGPCCKSDTCHRCVRQGEKRETAATVKAGVGQSQSRGLQIPFFCVITSNITMAQPISSLLSVHHCCFIVVVVSSGVGRLRPIGGHCGID